MIVLCLFINFRLDYTHSTLSDLDMNRVYKFNNDLVVLCSVLLYMVFSFDRVNERTIHASM